MKRKQDELDLDAIVARYRPIVGFRVKRAFGPANPDWEDIVNEILADVIVKIRNGEFEGRSTIGTFIYTIASRRIVDYIRLKTKHLRYAPEPPPLPDPQELAELGENAERLARAIDKLKPRFKEVLYLYYFQELSREEVARRLGLTPRRVSERVNYAHKLLRKLLQQEDFFQLSGSRPTKVRKTENDE
jgi:RNA polymerase sigma-70 factor (ECF subfamily)